MCFFLFLFFVFNFVLVVISETSFPAKPQKKASNSSMRLAEYLATEYDNTVRPNCESGELGGKLR